MPQQLHRTLPLPDSRIQSQQPIVRRRHQQDRIRRNNRTQHSRRDIPLEFRTGRRGKLVSDVAVCSCGDDGDWRTQDLAEVEDAGPLFDGYV